MIEQLIKRQLKAAGLRNRHLQAEMLDHFMCSYEEHLENGYESSEALEVVIKEINTNDLGSMNRSYLILNLKSNVHMNVLCFCFASVLAIFGFGQFVDQDPPSMVPVKNGEIVSSFGMRMNPVKQVKKMHYGIDIKAEEGTEVLSPEYAVVKEAGYHTKKGNYIVLSHDEVYETQFYHLKDILVSMDQKIAKGTVIGTVGSTGASMRPHLHYEVLKNGKRVNPKDYL